MSIKNCNDPIRKRIRDFLAFSAVPEPTELPRSPQHFLVTAVFAVDMTVQNALVVLRSRNLESGSDSV